MLLNWSENTFDGLPHVLRVFPTGESTMPYYVGLLHGDYVAQAQGNNAVAVTLFSWPTSPLCWLCDAIRIVIARVSAQVLTVDVEVTVATEISRGVDDYLCLYKSLALFDHSNAQPMVSFHLGRLEKRP
ncbi:hypothetical protein AC1031_017062 [Aphanomyces cochlioides]|nr:hypothetical protein AC1031_017062 [Aphanomyces cochlioides]